MIKHKSIPIIIAVYLFAGNITQADYYVRQFETGTDVNENLVGEYYVQTEPQKTKKEEASSTVIYNKYIPNYYVGYPYNTTYYSTGYQITTPWKYYPAQPPQVPPPGIKPGPPGPPGLPPHYHPGPNQGMPQNLPQSPFPGINRFPGTHPFPRFPGIESPKFPQPIDIQQSNPPGNNSHPGHKL